MLWNAVEKSEKASNAQLAREVELALPKELILDQQIQMVQVMYREILSIRECVRTLQSIVRQGLTTDTSRLTVPGIGQAIKKK